MELSPIATAYSLGSQNALAKRCGKKGAGKGVGARAMVRIAGRRRAWEKHVRRRADRVGVIPRR